MNVAAVEQGKYEALWSARTGKGYRSGRSPGKASAAAAMAALRVREGETIIDYGCGPGLACEAFRAAGLRPIGVDIARNALDEDLRDRIRFVHAPLWDLPATLLPAEWCYCTDVLEHLPPDRINAAFAGMAARATKGGYIQVALVLDRHGPKLAGEHLHQTIEPVSWWMDMARTHFRDVRLATRLNGFDMRRWQAGMLVAA